MSDKSSFDFSKWGDYMEFLAQRNARKSLPRLSGLPAFAAESPQFKSVSSAKNAKKKAKRNEKKNVMKILKTGSLLTHDMIASAAKTIQNGKGKVTKRDIPWWDAVFRKGTQVVEVRMYIEEVPITTTTVTSQNATYPVSFDKLNGYSNFQTVFDEFRVVRAAYEYYPNMGSTFNSPGLSVGVVDYTDGTALSSFDAGRTYDTHKIFTLATVGNYRTTVWPVTFEKLPNQEWVPTASDTIIFMDWKSFTAATHSLGNQTYAGAVGGWVDVQFRASKAT